LLYSNYNLLPFIVTGILFFFIAKYPIKFLLQQRYNAVQRIHTDEVPRLGGLVIFIGLFLSYFSIEFNYSEDLVLFLFLSTLPIFIICLREDLYHDFKDSASHYFYNCHSAFL
jgi:UDP-N-acetylmuramyl pentapeptide phosphotransferase/UDP-N-acetylglucosamine-1-phosphate transferase